ncbi:MAG: anti-sigma F factor [Clostridia bacterium]|nr:anti-sigma F factor [Oscillospiraceae bacterium]MBQ4135723.1 anti-sigma F factor [Clostridia bacterium]
MRTIINEMKLRLPAISVNESVCRSVISAFLAELDPTVEELGDVRLAVSEAVTNCIVHAYRDIPSGECGNIYISVRLYNTREVSIEISDNGCGIENVEEAMKPMFTTGDGTERCGMGFLVMESFTDALNVKSKRGKGTTVLMRKFLKSSAEGEK